MLKLWVICTLLSLGKMQKPTQEDGNDTPGEEKNSLGKLTIDVCLGNQTISNTPENPIDFEKLKNDTTFEKLQSKG